MSTLKNKQKRLTHHSQNKRVKSCKAFIRHTGNAKQTDFLIKTKAKQDIVYNMKDSLYLM